jgi:dihydrofolate reductase
MPQFLQQGAVRPRMIHPPRPTIIAAVASNGTVGRGNRLPWRLPEDLRRFKQLTLGHAVIMGRKTFESILAATGKPLPGRENIVITRSHDWSGPGCRSVHSLEAALRAVPDGQDAFVIGGGEIYALALPLARRLYLTEIEQAFEGDAFFPEFDRSRWREVARERRVHEGPGGFGYAFVEYRLAG